MHNEDEVTEETGAPSPAPTDPEPRQAVGWVDCPYCAPDAQPARVKKNMKGKLYYVCAEHSVQHMNSKAGQEWLLNNMRDKPERPKGEAPAAPPPTKSGGFMNDINNW